MINGLPPSAERFLLDVRRHQRRLDTAQRQLTSGLKLTRVSDAPDQVSRLLTARNGLERVEQTQLNLGRVKTEVDTAEKALATAVSLVERARVLGAQGSSGHQDAGTRAQVAAELQGVLERLVATANVAVEGRYLFSGDSDQTAPYELDMSRPSGVSAYQGTASTRKVADSSGLTFGVGFTAELIFESPNPDEQVFAAVNGMRRALLAVDNPPDPPDPTIPTIEEALHNLGSASVYLNQRLATYGIIQNRVTESIDAAAKLELSLRTQVANIEEADLAEAATDLTQARLQLDAAFQTRANTPRRSLFDYLG
jgi:flagellar hook-associated protein 3 FlgL